MPYLPHARARATQADVLFLPTPLGLTMRSAWKDMIISTALPNVAFRRPPVISAEQPYAKNKKYKCNAPWTQQDKLSRSSREQLLLFALDEAASDRKTGIHLAIQRETPRVRIPPVCKESSSVNAPRSAESGMSAAKLNMNTKIIGRPPNALHKPSGAKNNNNWVLKQCVVFADAEMGAPSSKLLPRDANHLTSSKVAANALASQDFATCLTTPNGRATVQSRSKRPTDHQWEETASKGASVDTPRPLLPSPCDL